MMEVLTLLHNNMPGLMMMMMIIMMMVMVVVPVSGHMNYDDSSNHDNVDCDGDGGAHARPAQPPAIQAALLSYSTTSPSTCQLPNSQIIPSTIVMRRILVLLFCKSFSFPIYWNIDIMYVSVMNFLNLL